MENNFTTFQSGISKRAAPKNFSNKDLALFEHEFQKTFPKTHVELLNNVYVNYWGYIYNNFKVNPKSFRGERIPGGFKFANRIVFFLKNNEFYKKKKEYETAIWFTDPWSTGYFHWFTDALPRLFLVLNHVNQKTKLLISRKFLMHGYILKSLKLLGIDKECIETIEEGEIAYIKHLFLPNETSSSTGNYHDILFASLRRKIEYHIRNLKDIDQGSENRVYITRMNSSRRKVLNEAEVIELIHNYGFKIYDFDTLPWLAQVKLCYHSKTLMSLHGAAITNMIFMKDGGSIIELRRRGDHLNNCYFSLANTCYLNYYYLECDKKNVIKKKIGDGIVEDADVTVPIASLKELLDSYFLI